MVQCKYQDLVDEDVVVQIFVKARSENADRAYIITTMKFTGNAKEFANNNESKTVIIDGDDLKKRSLSAVFRYLTKATNVQGQIKLRR